MSHANRVDFAQQFKQHMADGHCIADFVNQHTVRLSKDSDYIAMIAAESCLLAKQPSQIKALFPQFLHVENPQHQINLITKGFEFLAHRNWKQPDVLNEWYLKLVSHNAQDYCTRMNKTWKSLALQPKTHSAFIHYMSITPKEYRHVMETMVLERVNKHVWSNPKLFIQVIPQISLSSAVKLQQYMTHNRSAFEKPEVLSTIFSSLEPCDQTKFFLKFSQTHYSFSKNDTRLDDDLNLVRKYWEGIIPYICSHIKTINEDNSGKLRQQSRFGILLVTALTHDFVLNHTHTENIDTVQPLYEQIITYLRKGRIASYFDHADKAIVLLEEMGNKIQALQLLKEVGQTHLHNVKRKI